MDSGDGLVPESPRDRRNRENPGRRDVDFFRSQLQEYSERLVRAEDRFDRVLERQDEQWRGILSELKAAFERMRDQFDLRVDELEEFHIREQARSETSKAEQIKQAQTTSAANKVRVERLDKRLKYYTAAATAVGIFGTLWGMLH